MGATWALTAAETAAQVRAGRLAAEAAAEAALARLEAVNPALNAVVETCAEGALAEARAVDAALAEGRDPGPLAGVPVTVKVNVDMAGHATTNGLTLQRDLVAASDSPVVASLRRAGAVVIGRTNTPAFSLRWFTRNRLHGATRNPHDAGLTPGGSSGGAGAAVAAGIGALAIGTDIAGSVRYPAYACGVHGLRPSLGRVAAFNASGPERAIGPQLTAVPGPLARTIADLGLAISALSAPDPRDVWQAPGPVVLPDAPRRVAYAPAPEGLVLAPAVRAALDAAAEALARAGWTVEEVSPPPLRAAAEINLALWMHEFEIAAMPKLEPEGDPDALIIAPLLRAAAAACGSPLDALARRVTLLRQWQVFLADWPVLLCPVSAEPPFADHLDVTGTDAFARVLEAQLTQVALPALGLASLAVATGAPGRPMGVQLIAGRFREELLLAAGADIEAAHPPILPVDPFVAGNPR